MHRTRSGFVRNYSARKKFTSTGRRFPAAVPLAGGNSRPSGGYDAPSYDAPSYDAPSYDAPSYDAPSYDASSVDAPSYDAPSYDASSVDAQCSRSDAVVSRASCPFANCAARSSLTGRACACQAQSYAGTAPHDQRAGEGYEGRRSRRSGGDRRAHTAGHQPATDAERRQPEGPAGEKP